MAKAPTKVIEGGRVTIPAPVRRELDLSRGDYVIIDVERVDDNHDGGRTFRREVGETS